MFRERRGWQPSSTTSMPSTPQPWPGRTSPLPQSARRRLPGSTRAFRRPLVCCTYWVVSAKTVGLNFPPAAVLWRCTPGCPMCDSRQDACQCVRWPQAVCLASALEPWSRDATAPKSRCNQDDNRDSLRQERGRRRSLWAITGLAVAQCGGLRLGAEGYGEPRISLIGCSH